MSESAARFLLDEPRPMICVIVGVAWAEVVGDKARELLRDLDG
jgi:hypothetical protein